MSRIALPLWVHSVRLRLTLLYSLVLFSLAAIVVAVVVTLIPLLRRREDDYDGAYDSK